MPEEGLYADLFLDRRRRPRLWPCAVLFVDLLGVRAKATDRRRVGAHLRDLEAALRGSVRDFLRDDSPWPAAFFSDTLVVAAPIVGDGVDAEGPVGSLITQAAWLQWDLTRRGYFVRGAVTVGKLHFHRGLVFGPALVEAYDLENERAIHPRIILGDAALKVMEESLPTYATPAAAPQNWELLRDQDGITFIDYLTASIVDYQIDPAEEGVEHHRDLVAARLEESRATNPVWEKYRWSAEYHDAVVARLFSGADAERLALDAGPPSRVFARFVSP